MLTSKGMNSIFHLHSALLSHTEDQAVTKQKETYHPKLHMWSASTLAKTTTVLSAGESEPW
jgi:hypothetical protein